MRFLDGVYRLCRKIPKGKVTTYKILAEKLGTKAHRAVGQAMKLNKDAPRTPCHRVVLSNGAVGNYSGKNGVKGKIKLLKKEHIKTAGGNKNSKIIDFEKKLYRF